MLAADHRELLNLRNAAGDQTVYFGVELTPTSDLGMTEVAIRGNEPACTSNPGDQIVSRCYSIAPQNQVDTTGRFWFTEAERAGHDARELRVWHFKNTEPWSVVGTYPDGYNHSESTAECVSNDGLGCYAEVSGIDAFSPFLLGPSPAPTAVSVAAVDMNGTAAAGLLVTVLTLIGTMTVTTLSRRRLR